MTALLRRLCPLALGLALLLPAAARADTTTTIVRDCQDGHIDGHYSQAALAKALQQIPTDLDEYSSCRDVIRTALLPGTRSHTGSGSSSAGGAGGTGGGSTGGGASGGTPAPLPSVAGQSSDQVLQAATPQQRAQVAAAIAGGDDATTVGGQTLSPLTSGFSPGGDANRLPTSVILVLVLLAGGAATGGGTALRRRRRGPIPRLS